MHYSILIQWSEEDQSFVASLPEFGPYALTHGSTDEDALRNAMEALDLLIADTSPTAEPADFPYAGRKSRLMMHHSAPHGTASRAGRELADL